jgi:hypothetical protein
MDPLVGNPAADSGRSNITAVNRQHRVFEIGKLTLFAPLGSRKTKRNGLKQFIYRF